MLPTSLKQYGPVFAMSFNGLCCVLIVLIIQTCAVYGQEDIIKSSLTFVIDDTYSMWNEIDQVKKEANIIFEKVLSSNASQIENFVLVTFNDPTAELRTITKDRNNFKRALAAIDVHGGDDCPEYAMKGIEIALVESLPLSYLYVFTDASAKDHARFEQINSIAQKKQSQVVFILTGECGTESDPDFQVYYKVAEATSGQVFHMMKDDVRDILKYIEESITGRGITVINTKLPPGYGKTIKYPVDSHTGEVLISVTGKKPKIGEVIGPDGSKPTTKHIVSGKDRMAVVQVTGAKPGEHEVEVGSKSETHAIITAKSTLNFQLGFSVFRPTTIKVIVTRPPPDGNAFLGIKLLGKGVKLTTAKILDLSYNVITELPLELVDEKSQFYVTPPFNPPTTMFRVSVSGNDVDTKLPITRTGPTPIARQDPSTEKPKNRSPVVKIEGAPNIITEYDSPLQLKCHVHGYPPPHIIWDEIDSGLRMPATIKIIEVPYDFVSILDIEKANKNATYQCKAINPVGTSTNNIQVKTKRTIYFDVIETPKDISVEYTKEASIVCKVDAYPPVSITWYKDGKVFNGNINVDISSDKSILTIKNMQPYLQGKFLCEARNDLDRKVFVSKVVIFGVEEPIIDRSVEEIRVTEKKSVELSCRILQGIPKPTITWSFQPADKDKYRVMKETGETIHLENVGKGQTGSYKCVAKNPLGSDRFTMELIVEYQPKIKDDVKIIRSKDDDEVKISCDVTGEPAPKVKWFFNGTTLENTAKTRISSNHSLKLRARLPDTGYYTCEAENKLGSAKKPVFLYIFVPVTIDSPEKSTIETMVGKNTILYCRADGHPKPNIKWIFQSSDPKIPAKDVTPTGKLPTVTLRNVQLNQQGFYTCVAENRIGGSANITYEVKVFAPPIIENVYPVKIFEAVEGDLALRIQCKATGSPKPTIVWKKDDLNLAIGSDWYEMEKDGTLIIKNIDYDSQGAYVCLAQNTFGNDTELYEVKVKNSTIERPASTIFVEEGKSIDIKCDISHKSTDQIRWYKDGLAIASEELKLFNVTRSDDGLYTCRVSDFTRSRSITTKVIIGFKPIFTTEEEETIEFVYGADAVILSCEAYGEPKPKDASWKHNGKELNTTTMSYPLGMILGATGTYDCEVSNEFGSIRRSFKVTSRDCILDLENDFPEKQPIMYSRSLGWPVYPINEGYMIIPHGAYFFLYCPLQFTNSGFSSNVMAWCERDGTVKINGNIYNFADIKCNKEIPSEILRTGIKCLPGGNTEYIKIGYRVHNEFLGVYDLCLDKDNNVPLFTKHKLSPDHTNTSMESEWSNSHLPLDFETLYDCKRQAYDIAATLGKGLRTDSCCFGKRQLVNSHNLLPGIPLSASFNYLNVIPHWSSCNSKNWDDVEHRVRKLAKSAGRDLIVITGTSNPRHGGLSTDITLHDGRGGNQIVPRYLWKVVQDPPTSSSLAIIQVNIPELSPGEASRYVLCPDICENIDWMESSNWNNVEDGFTYCCAIGEFEKAFGYSGHFGPEMKYVLFKASLIPDFYLAKK